MQVDHWIAINGTSCAMSSAPMYNPTVIPTPEQLFGFPTLEEALRAQHICLHQPIPKVAEFLQGLEPDTSFGTHQIRSAGPFAVANERLRNFPRNIISFGSPP